MNQSGKILIAGIGSAHGDDQAGWLVAEQLAAGFQDCCNITVRKAMIPLDLLDWLDGVDVLHVCDACEKVQNQIHVDRFVWNPSTIVSSTPELDFPVEHAIRSLRHHGSHDFGITEVLRLASELRKLPASVIIWAVDGRCFRPGDQMCAMTRSAAMQAASCIMGELRQSHA